MKTAPEPNRTQLQYSRARNPTARGPAAVQRAGRRRPRSGETMAFDNAAPSRAATRRANKELILGVGGRAFIHRPHAATLAQSLAGDREQSVPDDLTDGEEV